MTWDAWFSSTAVRDLSRLPVKIAGAVYAFSTGTLLENPARMSKPLRDEFEGLRSARRGEYRILFWLDEEAGLVRIVRIAHRSMVYRPPAPDWD